MDLIYWGTSENCVPRVDLVEAGKMGKREDLNKFDKGQSTSRTAALVQFGLQW